MKNVKFFKMFIVIVVAISIFVAPLAAEASIIDNIVFRILGLVIVWGADAGYANAPIVEDFVLMTTGTGNAGADLIAANGTPVITGSLTGAAPPAATEGVMMQIDNPTSGGVLTDDGDGYLDAGDSLTAFGIDATTDVSVSGTAVQHSFYVASNRAFDIYAQSSNLATTGDLAAYTLANISRTMTITVAGNDGLAYGANAQDPTGAASGVVNNGGLDTISAAFTQVFDGGQRTAAAPGTIATQSVRFTNTYSLTAYDLSQGYGSVSADVTYTIYVP
jgi:hypothetical protein